MTVAETPQDLEAGVFVVPTNTLAKMMDATLTNSFQNTFVKVLDTFKINNVYMHRIYVSQNPITKDASLGAKGAHTVNFNVDLSDYTINLKNLELDYSVDDPVNGTVTVSGSTATFNGAAAGAGSFDFYVVDSNNVKSNVSTISFTLSNP